MNLIKFLRKCVSDKEYNKIIDKLNAERKTRVENERILLIMKKLNPNIYEEAAGLIDENGFLDALKISRNKAREKFGRYEVLLSEMRRVFLVELDVKTGEPKASMKEILDLWDEVNNALGTKTIGAEERSNNLDDLRRK